MTDTTACPSCGAGVPTAAAFCTQCGERLTRPEPDPAVLDAPVGPDRTEVATPGLHDVTQTAWIPPDPSAPPSWQPPVAPPPPQPGPTSWSAPPATPAPAGYAPPSSPPSGTAGRRGSILGGLVGLAGGALTVAGVFSSWVELGDTGTVTGWSLTQGDGLLKSNDPYLLVVLGLVAGIGGLVLLTGAARTLTRVAMVLVGVTIVTVTALHWLSIADFVETNLPSTFEATAAVGFYLTVAGGVLTGLAALMPGARR